MDDQRISVDTRAVRLVLSDGSCLDGDLFLHLQGAHHSGPQRVGDLLNGDELFLPVRNSGKTGMVNLEQVVSVAVATDQEFDELLTLGEEHRICVIPEAGEPIDARIFVNLPGGRVRVKDFLNQPQRFLMLLQGDHVVYIARQRILRVED